MNRTHIAESENNFNLLFRHCSDGLLVADTLTRRFIMANPSICRMLGYSEEEFTELTIKDIHPEEDRRRSLNLFIKPAAGETESIYETQLIKKDGSVLQTMIGILPLTINNRDCQIGIFRDISEQVQLEDQLHQSQKMEAIGQLTGGITHDFNNILTTIMGYSSLLLSDMEPEDPNRTYIAEIQDAGERAAILIRQLMAFSRRQAQAPVKTDLRTVVQGIEKILRRLIGEDIAFITDYSSETSYVKIVPGQMEQILMNLAVNARDAMNKGGILTIGIRSVTLDNAYCSSHPGSKAGDYSMISLADTGVGIPPDIREKIFDPFFTTKEASEGTGLGLSIASRIVKQSGGHIEVESKAGEGTCFKVYLPVYL